MGLDLAGRLAYPPPDTAWLGQHREPVLDPDLSIVDAHHHLWVEDGRPYLLGEVTADVEDGHRIVATVFVQAHYSYRSDCPVHLAPVGETDAVAAIATTARIRGSGTTIAAAIVGFADLTLGDRVAEVLDAHDAAANGAFRGVRHSVSRDPHFPDGIILRPAPEALLGNPQYRAGLRAVAARGLSYDAMLYHRQLPELVALARAMPDLPIVLDHAGCVLGVGPYAERGRETFAAWREDMTELARCPNVVVKIGGFGMVICGARWHERERPPGSEELADVWRPAFETCFDLFGADRCMFESNFPVDKAMYSYRTLWNAFKRLAAGLSAEERSNLFAGTAARTYRIDLPTTTAMGRVAHG